MQSFPILVQIVSYLCHENNKKNKTNATGIVSTWVY